MTSSTAGTISVSVNDNSSSSSSSSSNSLNNDEISSSSSNDSFLVKKLEGIVTEVSQLSHDARNVSQPLALGFIPFILLNPSTS